LVELLLQDGKALVTCADSAGQTPLHLCVAATNVDPRAMQSIAVLLLSHPKVELDARNAAGKTCLDVARNARIAQLIRDAISVRGEFGVEDLGRGWRGVRSCASQADARRLSRTLPAAFCSVLPAAFCLQPDDLSVCAGHDAAAATGHAQTDPGCQDTPAPAHTRSPLGRRAEGRARCVTRSRVRVSSVRSQPLALIGRSHAGAAIQFPSPPPWAQHEASEAACAKTTSYAVTPPWALHGELEGFTEAIRRTPQLLHERAVWAGQSPGSTPRPASAFAHRCDMQLQPSDKSWFDTSGESGLRQFPPRAAWGRYAS